MFGHSKRERAEREIREIEDWILDQSMVHGRRLESSGKFETTLQPTVALEACGFFLHAVSRLSYRPGGEKLRERIFDPLVRQMVRRFGDMVAARREGLELTNIEQDTLNFFNNREVEYGRAPRLLSDQFNDLQSAVWLAAHRIAGAARIPEVDIRILPIATALTESLIAMDVANRIKRVEAWV
jgi:hypothetical protein